MTDPATAKDKARTTATNLKSAALPRLEAARPKAQRLAGKAFAKAPASIATKPAFTKTRAKVERVLSTPINGHDQTTTVIR